MSNYYRDNGPNVFSMTIIIVLVILLGIYTNKCRAEEIMYLKNGNIQINLDKEKYPDLIIMEQSSPYISDFNKAFNIKQN